MLSRQREAATTGKPTLLKRQWINLGQISPELQRAVLVGEDDHFYQHHGFDFTEIEKAWHSNQKGRKVRGASTISQQAARNLFLWQGRSWIRKGLEAYYTVLLEALLPKDRIFELYLNVAEWGDRIFGVEAAAQQYFKKSASALTRVEAAALSASLPNPRKYPPTGSTRFQRRRQALILKRMGQPLETGPGRVTEEEDTEIDGAVSTGVPAPRTRLGSPSPPVPTLTPASPSLPKELPEPVTLPPATP